MNNRSVISNYLIQSVLPILLMFPSVSIFAQDTVNGWSGDTTILSVESAWSYTHYVLSNVPNGCGHDNRWRLDFEPTHALFEQEKAKTAMLLSAYMAGKTVNLRCENSRISDFTILN